MKAILLITFLPIIAMASPHQKIGCSFSAEQESDAYPLQIKINILSSLLENHELNQGIKQLSVDTLLTLKSGNEFWLLNSDKFNLHSISFNHIDITFNSEQGVSHLLLNRESLVISSKIKSETTNGTSYSAYKDLYKCQALEFTGV
jgi:hypothetical protein